MPFSNFTEFRKEESKMSGIKQICGKELARVFKDKKMIFSVFFLPVIIMVGIMTLVSSLSSSAQEDVESH